MRSENEIPARKRIKQLEEQNEQLRAEVTSLTTANKALEAKNKDLEKRLRRAQGAVGEASDMGIY